MARQGYSYNTADGARVIYQTGGEDLVDVPRDGKTVGEIAVRGNLVMKEVNAWHDFCSAISHIFRILQYFADDKATEKAFKGGYFHTGDLAVMYPDGSVSIQDRSKDIIISGGEVCDPPCPFDAR